MRTRADVLMPAPNGDGQLWVIDFAVTHNARVNVPAWPPPRYKSQNVT
jgi:hypothetical protein